MALESDSLGALNAYALKEREKNQSLLKAEAEKRVRDYEAELQTLLGSLDAYQKQGTQTAQPLDPNDPMYMQKLQMQQQREAMTGSQFRLPGQNSLDAMAADPNYNPQAMNWESMQAGAQEKLRGAQEYAQGLETVPGYQEAVNKARGGGAGDLDAYLFGAMSADDGTQSRLHAAKTQGEQLGLRGMEQQRRDADYMQSLQAKRGELAQGNKDKYQNQQDMNEYMNYLQQFEREQAMRMAQSQGYAINPAQIQHMSTPWGAGGRQANQRDVDNQLDTLSGYGDYNRGGYLGYADWRGARRESQNKQPQGSWLNQNKPKNSGWGESGGW